MTERAQPLQLPLSFLASSGADDSSVSSKEVLAVNIETGKELLVNAEFVEKRKIADRERNAPREKRWHRQHRFFCLCCGKGTEYTHVKGAEHRHKAHKKVKLSSTHWRLKDGHRHKRGCPDHKKDLQALLGARLSKEDYVLKPSFVTPPARISVFNQTSDSSGEGAAVIDALPKGKRSADDKIIIADLRGLEDALDFLRDELSREQFERVKLQIPRMGKVSAKDSFFDCDEGQDLIDSICDEVKGPLFMGVVPDVQCVNRSDGNIEFICHGMPVDYLGQQFVLRPVVSIEGDDFSDVLLSEHIARGEAIRVMIDPDSCTKLAEEIERNVRRRDPKDMIEFVVSVDTFNNVPSIGRPQNVAELERDSYLRPEWFPE